MSRYYVSNWRLLVGSCLGFLGALVIASDKFPPVHRQMDQVPKWHNINRAIADLDVFDYTAGDGAKIGFIAPQDPGFADLAEIIMLNRPELKGKIVGIAQNSPIDLAGVPSKIIHVALEGQKKGVSITSDHVLHEWVAKYRERFFLKCGLFLVTMAFLLGIIGRIGIRRSAPNQAL